MVNMLLALVSNTPGLLLIFKSSTLKGKETAHILTHAGHWVQQKKELYRRKGGKKVGHI